MKEIKPNLLLMNIVRRTAGLEFLFYPITGSNVLAITNMRESEIGKAASFEKSKFPLITHGVAKDLETGLYTPPEHDVEGAEREKLIHHIFDYDWFIMTKGEEPFGLISWTYEFDGAGPYAELGYSHLNKIEKRKDIHGIGRVGREAVRQLIDECKGKLTVQAYNDDLVKMYRKWGFVRHVNPNGEPCGNLMVWKKDPLKGVNI